MADINEIIFTGRVGSDIELKHTPDGTPTCSFPLAVERPKAKNAESAEVDWFTLVVWDKQAEIAAKYLTKGAPITVRCTARNRKWKDKYDQNRIVTEFRVMEFRMSGSKPKEISQTAGAGFAAGFDADFEEISAPAEDVPF